MKKKVLKIAALVLAVVIVAGGAVAYAFFLPHPLNYDINSVPEIGSSLEVISSDTDEVTVKAPDGEFKVLAFTDMHLDGKNKTSAVTVKYFVENIVNEKPDLVILNGDNVTSAFNKKRCRQLCEIFEKLGVYWAGGLGNHEGDNGLSVSRGEMIDIFSSYEHCLIKQGAEDIWGVGNYALTVLNADDSVKQVYYFMDTGDEMSEEDKATYGIDPEKSPYDGVKPSQVEWYAAKNAALKEKYGDFRSTLFTHIPLLQMKNADEGSKMLYGEKLENICASGFDAGLFDAMKTGGTTLAAFFGHDHLNTFAIEADGILLGYLQPSGYGSYTAASRFGYEEKDWLQGYTAFEIAEDGTFTSYRVRNSEGEKLPGAEIK